MTTKNSSMPSSASPQQEPRQETGQSLWTRAFHKLIHDKVGMYSLLVVLIYFGVAVGVWLGLLGTEWTEIDGDMWEPMSKNHWAGTNINGQDIFERALYGTSVAFEVGLTVAIFANLIGAVFGAISGYFSGTYIDQIIAWLYGSIDAIPFYLLVAAIAFAMQESLYGMHVAMIAAYWTTTCQVIRGEFIKIKNFEYVEAARALGIPTYRIIFKHILPNTFHLLLVTTTITFIQAIKSEVILSFLGLGIKEGVSWGLMFSESASDVSGGILNNFMTASLFMFGLVFAFNLFSDALQDALDPKKV